MTGTNTLDCYYCVLEGKKSAAHMTAHDRRGCLHVCLKHAKWRMTTSWMFGHSSDCPFDTKSKEHQRA